MTEILMQLMNASSTNSSETGIFNVGGSPSSLMEGEIRAIGGSLQPAIALLNHSCDPNLYIYSVFINNLDPNMPQLAMFARRDIKRGEQITFDYCQSSSQDQAQPEISSMMASPSKAVSRTIPESGDGEEERDSRTYLRSECRCGASNCPKVLF